MPTKKKSVITSSTSYIRWKDCYPSCPTGSSCWGTSSGAIKFCITNGKNPNEGALPGDMMMTEEISRGSGIVESFTNTGLRVWTWSETQTPIGKAMKGLLDEAIRQNPWQQSVMESFTNTGLRVWTFSDSESTVAKAMKGLLDEYIRQNPWQQM